MLEKSDLCRSQLSLRASPLDNNILAARWPACERTGRTHAYMHVTSSDAFLIFLFSHFLYKILLSYLNGDCRQMLFVAARVFLPIPFWSECDDTRRHFEWCVLD